MRRKWLHWTQYIKRSLIIFIVQLLLIDFPMFLPLCGRFTCISKSIHFCMDFRPFLRDFILSVLFVQSKMKFQCSVTAFADRPGNQVNNPIFHTGHVFHQLSLPANQLAAPCAHWRYHVCHESYYKFWTFKPIRFAENNVFENCPKRTASINDKIPFKIKMILVLLKRQAKITRTYFCLCYGHNHTHTAIRLISISVLFSAWENM